MGRRIVALLTTIPRWPVWAGLFGGMFGLLAASLLFDRIGLARWQVDFGFLLGFGGLAALGTSLAEETLFRGVLLKAPPAGQSGYGAAALSAAVFALWHPFQTFLYHPLALAGDRSALVARCRLEDALRHPLLWIGRSCIMWVIHRHPCRGRLQMDFLKSIAARDWTIGIAAFVIGAWIF